MKIEKRSHLARLIPSGGVVIELGVAAGKFADELCRENPSIRYVGIDRWSDHHDENEMLTAAYRLESIGAKSVLHRMTFSDAVIMCEDGEADMIYIDGYAHTGQEGGETLRQWWPKLKSGGIFAGHDYDAESYPQTVAAVDAFVASLPEKIQFNTTGEEKLPSWWFVKP